MKRKNGLLALLLSMILVITSISPVAAAEFSSGEEDTSSAAWDVFQDGGSEEALFTEPEEVPEEEIPEETDLEEVDPEEEITDGAQLESGVSFSDEEDAEETPMLMSASRTIDNTNCQSGITSQLHMEAIEEFLAGEENLFTSGFDDLTDAQMESDSQKLLTAGENLRKTLIQRTTTKKVTLKLNVIPETEEDLQTLMDAVLGAALLETGVSNEGDYLNWSILQTQSQIVYDGSTYTIVYKFLYSDTYAQEQKVAAAVDTALKSMKFTSATTPYIKIRTIYDYICKTVSYDYKNLYDDSYTLKYSAYAAIINKTAVCQGYSLLLYRMLIEAGIENRMVPSENHIWNIVYLRGYYYNADATWDEGTTSENHQYFMKGSKAFSADKDHQREDYYASKEFTADYPTPVSDYKVQSGDIPSNGKCTHSWSSWSILQKATCTETGLKSRICSKCSKEDLVEISKTAHKWKYTSKKNNTHTAKCSVCGTSKTVNCTFENNLCTKCKGQRIPDTVTNLKITSPGYNKVKLTWDQVEGATGYEIFYLKGSTWKSVKKTSSTSCTYTGTSTYPLPAGTTCYFRVRAYCTVNGVTTYGSKSAKTGGKSIAAMPQLVSIKASAYNKVTITWKKAAGATSYLIYRRNGTKWERVATVEGANTTSYTHVSSSEYPVKAGTTYTYSVRSYTKTGNTYGLYDKTGLTVTPALGKVSLTVSKTSKGLKCSWKTINGAAGYQIQRYTDGKWKVLKTVDAKTLSYVDTSVNSGTSYQYRVRAFRTYSGSRVYGAYSAVKTAVK